MIDAGFRAVLTDKCQLRKLQRSAHANYDDDSTWTQMAIGLGANWVEAIEKPQENDVFLRCLQKNLSDTLRMDAISFNNGCPAGASNWTSKNCANSLEPSSSCKLDYLPARLEGARTMRSCQALSMVVVTFRPPRLALSSSRMSSNSRFTARRAWEVCDSRCSSSASLTGS